MQEPGFINQYLGQYFDEIEPIDFYRALFPKGELEERGHKQKGKYHAIAVELLPQARENRKNVNKFILYDDLKEIEQLLQSNNFTIISPISYVGRSRKSENARYIYALAIDLDGVLELHNLQDLFQQIDHAEYLPRPTYIVSSGTGLHLYYQFEKPIPCFKNIVQQLQELKRDLTRKIWNRYISSLYDNVQYESLFQGFRLVGGVTKSGSRTRVFEVGKKVSIEYLNEFVIDEKHKLTNYVYKSDLTLEEAKEKYPEWYKKRVEEKKPRGTWTTKKDLFYWWLRRIKAEAAVGHRYYAIMCLAVYAKKSGISQEELEEAAFELVEPFEALTNTNDNHFTRADILAALEMYNDSYITFPIDSISKLTDIPIEKNKRNHRKQEIHLKIARSTKEILKETGEMKAEGRPKGSGTKEKEVLEWRKQHPQGSKAACIRDTGLSKPTVYKYWE